MTQTIPLISERRRRIAQDLIWQAPNGHIARIGPPRRSNKQNDRMWAMIGDVSRAKPEGRVMTPEQWKGVFMREAGHQVQFLIGLDNEPFPFGYRSSLLTVKEMIDLQTVIEAYAAQQGIQLGDNQ